jgi:putative FmdB family regulatory protein
MPLHEYECDVCGHRFERIQKYSDPPIETCPKCGGHVHKLISAPAFQFKGSGFYITDYPKKDSTPESKSEDAPSKSDSKSEGSPSKSEGASTKSDGSSKGKDSAPAKADKSPATSDKSSAPSPKASTKDQKD